MILDYYQKVVMSSGLNKEMELVGDVDRKMTTEMREYLSEEFTTEEVAIAVKQMHPTKAVGPDCMAPIFFEKFWDTVGMDVTYATLQTLKSGTFPTSLNHMYITLIPKKKNP